MHNIVLIKIISKHNFLINDKGQWQSADFHRESKEPNERISIKYSKIKYTIVTTCDIIRRDRMT